MGGTGIFYGGSLLSYQIYSGVPQQLPQDVEDKLGMQMQGLDEKVTVEYFKSKAIGPKIRKLNKWSKQTGYGGEV